MKIERARDGEGLLAWGFQLRECMESGIARLSDYPPGEVDCDHTVRQINPAADWQVALWTDGGCLLVHYAMDIFCPDRGSASEILLRFRREGIASALRARAIEIAREDGIRDYYGFVANHAVSEAAMKRAPIKMRNSGFQDWSTCWRLAL